MKFWRLKTLSLCSLVVIAASPRAQAQTFPITPGAQSAPQTTDQAQPSSQSAIGWGSNIQNARLSRAAELALKQGKYKAAVDYAQRAANAAPNDPQLWFLLGYSARLAGRIQVALDAYNRGLRLSPSSPEGLSGLAQTYNIMGKKGDAERILTQALSANPGRTDDLLLLGEILLQSGQYAKALNELGRAEQTQPSARSELLIALTYQRSKQFNQANHYLELAKRHAPENPEVQRALAGFYRDTGSYSAAINILKNLARNNPEILAELAYTYQLYGKRRESAQTYIQAADLAPGNLSLQLSAARSQLNMGVLDAAAPLIKRASVIEPDNYGLYALRGEIASLEEHPTEAVREYQTAISHLPEAPAEGPLYGVQLHMDLMALYQRLHDENAAHRELDVAKSEIDALDIAGLGKADFLRVRALIRMNSGDSTGAGSDIQGALAFNPQDPDTLQLEGDLLTKLGRLEEASAAYRKILATDPTNRAALTSMGYLSRETSHDQEAEKYFQRLATADPTFLRAISRTRRLVCGAKGFRPKQKTHIGRPTAWTRMEPLIVAGAMNSAVEAHHFALAADWLKRATGDMRQEPHVLRETERYLNWVGEYQQSADVGQEAIKALPKDRDVVVYLGYDLLHLEKYDELLQLTSQYEDVFAQEPAIPLLAGYVHKHYGQLDAAQQDFTHVLQRDPKVVTGLVNRGYVLKDLHQPASAASDFESALRLEPQNGEAHLGLAYASLDLHHPRIALRQVGLAEKELGDSVFIHLIRATAYNEQGLLSKAVGEYRVALKYSPNQTNLHVALADALNGLHDYRDAITELETADKHSPGDSVVYAQIALAYAHLNDRERTLEYIKLAEEKGQSNVLGSTGEALSLIGERDAAMGRFEKALNSPDNNRLDVRLAIAKLMAADGHWDDARRQIALGLMEARSGETHAPVAEQYIQVADAFLGMHDFNLAQIFFERALAHGGPQTAVRIGLANAYLAQGDTERAQGQISVISKQAGEEPSYEYLLTNANILRQQHRNAQALTAFAQAASAAGQDETADRELIQAAGDEGLRINPRISFRSDFSVAPIFEDTTVYPLDAKLDVTNPLPGHQSLLPLPRSSMETQWTGAYHLHLTDLPDPGGFFQVRNDRGQISLPSVDQVVNRDTTDYSFNFGINPTFHLGKNVFSFNTGIQETIRRDSLDPVDMNQNLFRQFVYLSTSSFFNMVSVSGYAIRETGPFTETNLHSRDLSGALDFRVGRPWRKTAFVTGWGSRDLQFSPLIREYFYTSAYVGIEQKVSDRLSFKIIAEDLRAWRVEDDRYAIAQAIRPAGSVEYSPARNWSLRGSFAYSRNMGFHAYDAVQSGFALSYARPISRTFRDGEEEVALRYPLRFSAGMQQESFFNFTGSNSQQFRPYVQVSIF